MLFFPYQKQKKMNGIHTDLYEWHQIYGNLFPFPSLDTKYYVLSVHSPLMNHFAAMCHNGVIPQLNERRKYNPNYIWISKEEMQHIIGERVNVRAEYCSNKQLAEDGDGIFECSIM